MGDLSGNQPTAAQMDRAEAAEKDSAILLERVRGLTEALEAAERDLRESEAKCLAAVTVLRAKCSDKEWEGVGKQFDAELANVRRLQGGEIDKPCECVCHKAGVFGLMCCPCTVKALDEFVNRKALPAPPTAEPPGCKCSHPKERHNFKAVGECMECGCTGYVAAEPAKEEK